MTKNDIQVTQSQRCEERRKRQGKRYRAGDCCLFWSRRCGWLSLVAVRIGIFHPSSSRSPNSDHHLSDCHACTHVLQQCVVVHGLVSILLVFCPQKTLFFVLRFMLYQFLVVILKNLQLCDVYATNYPIMFLHAL